MAKKTKNDDEAYATVAPDEGVNYREIAGTMTELGYPMNHSSARNYVIRIMKKFLDAYEHLYDLKLDDTKKETIAKSSTFQHGVSELLHTVEHDRRERENNDDV